jgi:hypothetical protein
MLEKAVRLLVLLRWNFAGDLGINRPFPFHKFSLGATNTKSKYSNIYIKHVFFLNHFN